MKYYTFWSIFDAPTNSLKPATVLLVLSILTTIIWVLVKKFKEDKKNLEKPLLLWSTGILFFLLLTGFTYLRFFTVDDTSERLTKFLQSSRVAIVEGKISNMSRKIEQKKYGQIVSENFRVDSVEFSYDDNLLAQFNKFGKTNNKVFHNGLKVRITYLRADLNIQKIEVAQDN